MVYNQTYNFLRTFRDELGKLAVRMAKRKNGFSLCDSFFFIIIHLFPMTDKFLIYAVFFQDN